jgi:hypothetical protein
MWLSTQLSWCLSSLTHTSLFSESPLFYCDSSPLFSDSPLFYCDSSPLFSDSPLFYCDSSHCSLTHNNSYFTYLILLSHTSYFLLFWTMRQGIQSQPIVLLLNSNSAPHSYINPPNFPTIQNSPTFNSHHPFLSYYSISVDTLVPYIVL